jgi:hypothetical protein
MYFISFTWENALNSVSFGNGPIEEFPLKWLKENMDQFPGKNVKLLWWKQLTNEDEIKAAKSIGITAF